MKNLFEKGSIDDAAMKSRDKKRAMFVKVVTLLELVSKKDLGIDVDKILAGQEAEKTNLMLQIVGRLAGKADCVAHNAKYIKAVNKKLNEKLEPKNSGLEVEKDVEKSEKPEKSGRSEKSRPEKPKSERSKSEKSKSGRDGE